MTPYLMRRAGADDLGQVMRLLDARIDWLRERGSDQWSTRPFEPIMADAIRAGLTWLLFDHDTAVATLTVTTVGDPDFWTRDELRQPALYLSKLATDPREHGHGLGALLLDWANSYAASWGVSLLRWDVWRTNRGLQDYYQHLGIPRLRTVDVEGRWSGALYEVAYERPVDLTGTITTDVVRTAVTPLDSQLVHNVDYGDPDDPELYDSPRPDHAHRITSLYVPNLGSARPEPARELEIPSYDDAHVLVFNPGTGWHLKAFFCHPITGWTDRPDLHDGRLYTIAHQHGTDRCGVVLIGEFTTSPGASSATSPTTPDSVRRSLD